MGYKEQDDFLNSQSNQTNERRMIMDIKKAKLACWNILSKMKCSRDDAILIIFDEEKQDLAQIFAQQVLVIGGSPYMLKVPTPTEGKFASWFVKFLSEMVKTEFTVILLSHSMYIAKGIMDVIGRPDQGLGELSSRFFCDWTIPTDSLVRVESADPVEVEHYRNALLKELVVGSPIRVTTSLGTDVVLQARSWNASGIGEVFTAPVEDSANGVVVYDSSVYWAQPESPIKVTLENGKIKEIECVGVESEQYQMFMADSKKDKGASILAELGVGINPNADPHGHVMEAEQARGTCHFDFGNNIPFGGCNRSCAHYGGVVGKPTIYVDGRVVMAEGKLMSREEHE